MTVISNLEVIVQDKVEEARGLPGVFWNVQDEIRVFLVEAQYEALLVSGEPEIRQAGVTLAANTRFFNLQSLLMPPMLPVALMRLECSGQVQKTNVWDLDRMLPGWENDTGAIPDFWFPFGLTQFGVHPLLEAPVTATLSFIGLPLPNVRPFTGSEEVDFQQEYLDAFTDAASHICTIKEGGKELNDSLIVYDRFISKCAELGKFATRKGSLRFSRTMGVPAKITDVEQR